MDPLFERRELTRNVHIDARFLQRNIEASILAQLRMKFEGICLPEGYIKRQSIVIAEYSLGRANLIKGGVDYQVKFQCDLCMPHPGQVFRVPVTLKSKIGVHAEVLPIKVLLPRDLHLGVQEFEDIEEKQEIEFQVVGTRFQQGDDSIVVLGKLRNIVRPNIENIPTVETEETQQVIAAPIKTEDSGEKRVVTVDMSTTKPVEPVRRKRIRIPAEVKTNE